MVFLSWLSGFPGCGCVGIKDVSGNRENPAFELPLFPYIFSEYSLCGCGMLLLFCLARAFLELWHAPCWFFQA